MEIPCPDDTGVVGIDPELEDRTSYEAGGGWSHRR